jgi:N-acetylmuramoyl-L-alanine amidase
MIRMEKKQMKKKIIIIAIVSLVIRNEFFSGINFKDVKKEDDIKMLSDVKKIYNNDEVAFLLDLGHGGGDPGAQFYDKTWEKDFNLKIGLACYNKLKPYLKNIFITRTTDKTLNPNSRIKLINDYAKNFKRVDGYSFHGNSDGTGTSGQLNGTEIFISLSNNVDRAFCENFLKDYCGFFGFKNLGVKTKESKTRKGIDYYYIIRETSSNVKMKLLEWGFGNNRNNWAIMKTDKYIDQASDIFAEYVLARFGLSLAKKESKKEKENTYTVQVGSFSSLNTAKEFEKCLKKVGIDAFIK